MKKKILFNLILASLVIGFTASAHAATTANQTITGTLNPFMSVSNTNGTTTAVSINQDGSLSANLTPGFSFTSNNKNGASATFNVKVNTSDASQVDGISGSNNGTSGKIVLTNAGILPTSNAVKDGLSDTPTAANNPNVIAYQVSFNIDNANNGKVPAFDQTGSNVTGNVLSKNGSSAVTFNIDKNSVRSNTYSTDDVAGTYQATIYCTSALL
ncbi:MAG: hypothetical protein A2104_07850 [Candidatus Melainabacteria bacterium GWF2_32_7]|nr:MAG: hypothetical protein A2104_07850 [Candidatus Melainabacteria bacterium GWF2_32_7]